MVSTGGGEVAEYEHVREERMKENHVRMQQLGIKELSHNLKPKVAKPKVVRPKMPKVVTSPHEPPRRSSRKVGEREAPTEAAGKNKAAKEATEDPNKPKKPGSTFFVFLEEFREIFKKENPTVKAVSAVGKAGGEKWKSMSAAEKAPYEAKAAERKTDYEKLMAAYNKKQDAAEDDEESEKSKSEVDKKSGQDGGELVMTKKTSENNAPVKSV